MPVVASAPSRAIDLRRRRGGAKRKAARSSGRGAALPPLPWKRALLSGLVAAMLGLGGLVGWTAWREGVPEQIAAGVERWREALRGYLPFRLEEVTVEGRQYVPREALLKALEVGRGDMLLAVNLAGLRQRLEAIDWIEHAAVERRLPDSLHISLVERVAVAIWQRGENDFILIDRNGRSVRASQPPPGFERLLLIGGDGAPQRVGELFLLLAQEPSIARRLVAASWVGQRRWNLYLQDGIEVRLPEEDATAALQLLARYDASDRLLARDIAVVDLRLPDKMVLRRNAPEPQPEADPKIVSQSPRPPAGPPARAGTGRSM